jgi:hypothetical protein
MNSINWSITRHVKRQVSQISMRSILCHVYPLLDNDRETNNKTIAVTRQRQINSKQITVFFFCDPCRDVISRTVSEELISRSVELVKSWLVSEWVRGLLRFSPCELLLLEAGLWETRIDREPRGSGTSAVGSLYRKTGEDTAGWEELTLQRGFTSLWRPGI